MIIHKNTTKIQSKFNGTPDKVIPMKKNLVKDTEVKFCVFDGWTEYPIYKSLSELNAKDYKKYNKKDHIYTYHPSHRDSDVNGIREYKVIGATMKKSDKRVLLIVENKNNTDKLYYEINNDEAVYCGHVFLKTDENYNKVNIGEQYKGYRNSNWIKLDHTDYADLFTKIYSESFKY